jgi:hypothetical protein
MHCMRREPRSSWPYTALPAQGRELPALGRTDVGVSPGWETSRSSRGKLGAGCYTYLFTGTALPSERKGPTAGHRLPRRALCNVNP